MNSLQRIGCRRLVFAFLASSVMIAAIPWSGRVAADGAMAVGIAKGGVAKGYATGFSSGQANEKVARSGAIEGCRKNKKSNADARSNCEVVTTFRNKCVASAVDPKDSTPGAGWGVGSTQKLADAQAIARCKATAGADRAEFCEVVDRLCDTTTK